MGFLDNCHQAIRLIRYVPARVRDSGDFDLPNRSRQSRHAQGSGGARPRCGFTLIELIVVVVIIAILTAVLISAVYVVRQRAKTSSTKATILKLTSALETYKLDDQNHRYPLHELLSPPEPMSPYQLLGTQPVVPGYPEGVLGLLFEMQLYTIDRTLVDGRETDGWNGPIYYHLQRPAPAQGAGRLVDWNWDADNSRAKLWNSACDPPRPAPYPYIFSLGQGGSTADASTWIYHAR